MSTEFCMTEMPITDEMARDWKDPILHQGWRTAMENLAWQEVVRNYPDTPVKIVHGAIALTTKRVKNRFWQVLVMETTVHIKEPID